MINSNQIIYLFGYFHGVMILSMFILLSSIIIVLVLRKKNNGIKNQSIFSFNVLLRKLILRFEVLFRTINSLKIKDKEWLDAIAKIKEGCSDVHNYIDNKNYLKSGKSENE